MKRYLAPLLAVAVAATAGVALSTAETASAAAPKLDQKTIYMMDDITAVFEQSKSSPQYAGRRRGRQHRPAGQPGGREPLRHRADDGPGRQRLRRHGQDRQGDDQAGRRHAQVRRQRGVVLQDVQPDPDQAHEEPVHPGSRGRLAGRAQALQKLFDQGKSNLSAPITVAGGFDITISNPHD